MLTSIYANTPVPIPSPNAPSDISGITSGGIFSILSTILAVVGFLLIFYVLFVTIQAFAKGDIGKAFKRIIGGGIIIILCFNPGIAVSVVNGASNIVQGVVNTFTDTVKTPTGPQSPTGP